MKTIHIRFIITLSLISLCVHSVSAERLLDSTLKNIEINPITQLPEPILTFLKDYKHPIARQSHEP